MRFSILGAFLAIAAAADQEHHARIHRHGTMNIESDGSIAKSAGLVRREDHKPSVESVVDTITRCDKQFVMMAEGEANCTGSVTNPASEVISPEDCILASSRFGPTITKADPANFTLTNHQVSFQPHPRGCFFKTGTNQVYYNPTEAGSGGQVLIGQKICVREAYIRGTPDTAPADGCTDGTLPITNYTECWQASRCWIGDGAVKLPEFKENDQPRERYQDRPSGCLQNENGVWLFNYEAAPNGTLAGNFTTVCKQPKTDAGDATAATTAAPST